MDTSSNQSSIKTFYRSTTNRMIGGVAGGLGEYFNIDPLIIRILFIIFAFSGFGILIYFIIWILTPEGPYTENSTPYYHSFSRGKNGETGTFIGFVLIILGIGFLLSNFDFFDIGRLWPLWIILLGIILLFRR